MRVAVFAIGVVAIWTLGASILALLRIRRSSGIDVVVTDFVTGIVCLAVVGSFVVTVGLPLSPIPLYALIVGLAMASVARGRSLRVPTDLPASRTAAGVLLGTVALLVLLGCMATVDRLWWDGWAIWAFKAHVLFVEGTLPDGFFREYGFVHPDYPLALPLLDWWLFRHAGTSSGAVASFAGALCFALPPLLLWGALRDRLNERLAAAAAFGAASSWPLAFYALGGTADILMCVGLLGAVVELSRARDGREPGAIRRCGIYVTLAALAKNEGLALAVVAAAAGAASLLWAGRRDRRYRAAFALPFVALAPWYVFTSSRGVRGGAQIAAPESAAAMMARAGTVLSALADVLLSMPWLPIMLLAPLGLLSVLRHPSSRRELTAAWAMLLGYVSAVLAVYLFTVQDLPWLLETSLPRVAGATLPAVVYVSLVSVFNQRSVSA